MANETSLDNPNVQKFLDFIGKAEGADYNVIVGGKRFDDFSKHPGIVGLRTKEGPSTAAGKYQITKTTYDDFAPKLGITDFSPESQDRIAVEIFKREKALGDIQKGDFEAAINKLGGRFASLPSSKYSQPKKSWDFVQAELGTVAQGPSSTQKIASSAQPKPFKVAQGPQAAPKAAKVALTDLPQSYRSALALNYLVDSDPEDELMAKATELLQASLPDQGGGPAGGTILQKYAAQMPEINPYQFLQSPPTDQEPARMAAGGLVRPGAIPRIPRMFAEGGEVSEEDRRKEISARIQTEKINDQLADLLYTYRTTGTGAEQLALFTGLPVADIATMFGASDTNLPSAQIAKENQLRGFRETTPKVMTDEGTRIRPDYVLRSVPEDLTTRENREPLVDLIRRKQARRSAQMFANGGEVTNDDLFQQMIGGTPSPLQITPQVPVPMTTPRQSEVPQLDQFGRVVRDPVAPVPERSVLQQIIGAGETAATVGTNVLSAVPAALVGAKELLTPGQTRQGAEAAMMGTMERFTYAPRGEAGRENLDNLGKFLQATKLDAALPQTQLMSMRVAPGAARYLGERAREGTEAAVLPGLRAQTQNPQLQATDVYGAMLSPSETIKAGVVPAMPKTPVQRIERDSFVNATEELDKIPTTPEVEQVLSAHIGGVGNFGDPDAKYYLMHVPGGPEYTQQAQNVAQKYFGDQFMGYRLMPKEEFEALKSGDLGNLLSFSLSKDAANAFRKFALNQGREDLVLAEVPLTPSHILGFGHRGEQEVIVDTSVGWSLDAFKRSSAPKQKEAIDRSLLFPSAERPFVGELERRVADLPGPVQKEQLINSLRKTAREHEMVRLEQALENYGPKDKLTPNQIMSLLKDTSPQRYQLEVLEPQANRFYAGQDTPYPSLPLGTANLLLEPKQLQREIVGLMDEAQYMRSSMFADSIASDETKLKEFLTNINKLSDRVEDFDTELSRKLKQYTENFYEEVEPVAAASRVRQYVSYPSLTSNPDGLSNVAFNDLEGTLPSKIKGVLNNRGINFTDNRKVSVTSLFLAAREAAMNDYLKSIKSLADTENKAGTYLRYSMSASERDKLDEMLSPNATWKEDLASFYKAAQESDADKSLTMAERHAIGNQIGEKFATKINEMLSDFDYNLTATRKSIAEDLRAMPQLILDSSLVQQNKLFEGTHSSVVRKNPISFSRYVDLDAEQHNLPDPRGAMLFTELQSDRRKAVKNGVPGVEEAYPGMAKLSEDTLRELMVKSAVAATARRGKGIALFPSTDSNKPGLYSNIGRVVKKVAKDLGEGYQARQFDVVNEAGNTIKRWGIVLPDNASELPQKGIRFAKGGLVDRSLYDRA